MMKKLIALGVAGYVGYEVTSPSSMFHTRLVPSVVKSTGMETAEAAHEYSIKLLETFKPFSIGQKVRSAIQPFINNSNAKEIEKLLSTDLQFKSGRNGLHVDNCIGLAAGYDKDARVFDEMFAVGFGLVEIGSVTPLPQPGNDKPRVFRLPQHDAVINRYGFNSQGIPPAKKRLEKYHRSNGRVLGVNLGKNKLSESNTADYVQGIKELAPYADYVVINISSPNTPNLRKLQDKSPLEELLSTAVNEISQIKQDNGKVPPLFIKIAPDCTDEQFKDIADLTLKYNIDALIVSNTTIQTAKLLPEYAHITGGLSGRPVKDVSTCALKKMYQLTGGKVTLVGCGGVSSGQDAYEKIRNGASIVQLYTAMSLQGVGIARKIQKELAELLKKDGYTNVRTVWPNISNFVSCICFAHGTFRLKAVF